MSIIFRASSQICISVVSLFFGIFTAVTSTCGDPLSLTVQAVEEDADGLVSSYLQIFGGGFEGRRFPSSNWIISNETTEDASLSFYHRFASSLVMDFSVYPSTHLLDGLSAGELKNYVAELAGQYKLERYSMVEPKATKAPVGSMPFMGASYWKVRYGLASSVTQKVESLVLEFVTKTEDGKNYRLRFMGPPDSFEQLEPVFETELSRFLAM